MDTNEQKTDASIRLQDAVRLATEKGEIHYAYPLINTMTRDDMMVMIVAPDKEHGWSLTIIEGKYDGDTKIVQSGQPPQSTMRYLANLVFHRIEGLLIEPGMKVVELVRLIEDFEEEVVLHPHAARTIVETVRAQDGRVPIVTPSPFIALKQGTGIIGMMLLTANIASSLGMLATWGHIPLGLKYYVFSTTFITLGILCVSPFLLRRMAKEARNFTKPSAQAIARGDVTKISQMIITLAILTTINSFLVST